METFSAFCLGADLLYGGYGAAESRDTQQVSSTRRAQIDAAWRRETAQHTQGEYSSRNSYLYRDSMLCVWPVDNARKMAPSTPGVPVAALTQFLAAMKAKDFEGAKALAFQSMLSFPAARMHATLRSHTPFSLQSSRTSPTTML